MYNGCVGHFFPHMKVQKWEYATSSLSVTFWRLIGDLRT